MIKFIKFPTEPCNKTRYYIENEYSGRCGTIFKYPDGRQKQVYSSFLGKSKDYEKYGISREFIEANDFVKKSVVTIQRFYNKWIKYRNSSKLSKIQKDDEISNLIQILRLYKNEIKNLKTELNKNLKSN